MRLILCGVALFCAYIVGDRLAYPFVDGDLFWQRQLGEFVLTNHALPTALGGDVFSAPGAPWVPHEWLLGVFVALAMGHNGLWVLTVVAGLAVFVTLAITALRAKRAGAATTSTLASLLFAGICFESTFAVRAQVLAWPLLAALMLALDADGIAVLWAIPLVVAWANLHASVMLAIPIVWIDAAMFIWRRARGAGGIGAALGEPAVRLRLALCIGVPLATLCTPLGLRLPIYAFGLVQSPIRQYITEWQPTTGLSTQLVAGMLPLLALCVYGAARVWRLRPRDLVLTGVMAVATLFAARNISLFAILAAVAASLAIQDPKGWSDPLAARKYAFVPWLVLLVAVPLVGYTAYRAQPMTATWDPPVASIAALAALPGEHNLLCTDFSRCAYALGQDDIKVFLDGRADPFPPEVWDGFVSVAGMGPGWPETLDHFKVNALLVYKADPLSAAVKGMPNWQEVPQDDPCCDLFIRRSSKN
jgi:hypothetical protein